MNEIMDWLSEHLTPILIIGGISIFTLTASWCIYQDSKLPRHPVPYCESYEGKDDSRCMGYYSTHPSVDAGFVMEIVK